MAKTKARLCRAFFLRQIARVLLMYNEYIPLRVLVFLDFCHLLFGKLSLGKP